MLQITFLKSDTLIFEKFSLFVIAAKLLKYRSLFLKSFDSYKLLDFDFKLTDNNRQVKSYLLIIRFIKNKTSANVGSDYIFRRKTGKNFFCASA